MQMKDGLLFVVVVVVVGRFLDGVEKSSVFGWLWRRHRE